MSFWRQNSCFNWSIAVLNCWNFTWIYQLLRYFFPFASMIRKFWNLVVYLYAVWKIGERFFWVKQLGIGSWSLEKIIRWSEPKILSSCIVSENATLLSCQKVIEKVCSLVGGCVTYMICFLLSLFFIWKRTQPMPSKEESPEERRYGLFLVESDENLMCELF